MTLCVLLTVLLTVLTVSPFNTVKSGPYPLKCLDACAVIWCYTNTVELN